jgi:hypothetical protein
MLDIVKQILTSLAKTLIIAGILTSIINYFTGAGYIETFTTLVCVQFVASYVWKSIARFLLENKMINEETKRLELYAMQGTDVTCAHCNASAYIPVRFDDDNSFDCEVCGKSNSVYVDVTTAQKTTVGADTSKINKIIEDISKDDQS